MTDITELAHGNSLRKKLNRRLNDAYGFQRTSGGKHTTISLSIAECKSVIAALDERLALVESLEKAQETIAFQQGEIKALLSSLESRTFTVKLPDDEDGQAYGFGKWANGKLPATAGTMTIAYCEDAWRAAFEVFSSAAGIKVEGE
ncbi:TPA: hypothetical protein MYU74_000738 [Klebsiella pneumoniae]|uniref:hypothetical protein n=1 Tax=Klebsiella pneumoniae TaxID=573 RepID=UPI00388F144E|nr:hypothetical protein [Klebsiella pneumoniae]HBX7346365.1 hypothetical protein [Klebsiella pneumoniae]HCB3279705.1 hypothetical protein [Klebsiella pneumoniae]HCB3510263.1 hypothetical protein [Klebsiella pneumoniae]